jgi:hypothetical protein
MLQTDEMWVQSIFLVEIRLNVSKTSKEVLKNTAIEILLWFKNVSNV